MPFIEMTGATLDRVLVEDELHVEDLQAAGITDTTIVRVNHEGDIEVRRPEGWDVVGGLIGEFEDRLKRESGLNWA